MVRTMPIDSRRGLLGLLNSSHQFRKTVRGFISMVVPSRPANEEYPQPSQGRHRGIVFEAGALNHVWREMTGRLEKLIKQRWRNGPTE